MNPSKIVIFISFFYLPHTSKNSGNKIDIDKDKICLIIYERIKHRPLEDDQKIEINLED
ncbi:MAG: hypothetical protein K8R53_11205 [Bacteroidales bacterium]|nr:hypothetical protein [Bacteroidales bacterium]